MGTDLPVASAAELVRAAQRGDTCALDELIGVLEPYVGRICGAVSLDAAEDATQNTLMIIVRRLSTLTEPQAVFGWARTVAVREAIRQARRTERDVTLSPERMPETIGPEDLTLVGDVRDVLRRLPPDHRAVLVLRDLHDLDEHSAAALLDIPVGTVKSRLARARNAFKKAWTS